MQEKLLKKARNRKDGGIAREFTEVFENFVRAYEGYIKWMEMTQKRVGQYHDEENFSEYCKRNIDLIEDIKKNGVNDPIVIKEDKLGLEILDGSHRLIISKVCKKQIKVRKS